MHPGLMNYIPNTRIPPIQNYALRLIINYPRTYIPFLRSKAEDIESLQVHVHVKSLNVNFFHNITTNNHINTILILSRPIHTRARKEKYPSNPEGQLKGLQEVQEIKKKNKKNHQEMLLESSNHDLEESEASTTTKQVSLLHVRTSCYSDQ